MLNKYESCPSEQLKTMKFSVHEGQALPASMAFYGNTTITEIMKTTRSTIFTTFYVRHAVQNMEGIYQLGPLVVAQQSVLVWLLCMCACVCVVL